MSEVTVYMATVVCPRCKCGTAVQVAPDKIHCPRCGGDFDIKESVRRRKK